VKTVLRAMTKRPDAWDRSVMMSSVMPSLKNCGCHGGLVGGQLRSDLSQIDDVDADRPFDVLEGLLTLIDEFQLQLVARLLAHRRRTGDAARPSQGFQPCRQIDPVAVNVLAIDDDIAHVDADAEPDVAVFGGAGVALGHAALDFDRAADGVQHAGELDQDAVAHDLEDASVVARDGGIEELAKMGLQGTEGPLLVGLHQPGIANHVRRQNGRQTPLDGLRGHQELSPLHQGTD
jgi:hypothetical protein